MILYQTPRHTVHRFPNGYGASVLPDGEVAVIKFRKPGSLMWDMQHDHPGTLHGCVWPESVPAYLTSIETLP